MTILLMSGCASLGRLTDSEIERGITEVDINGCSWALPIYLSESSIEALRKAQETSSEVRADRVAIAMHNKKYMEFCSQDTVDEGGDPK